MDPKKKHADAVAAMRAIVDGAKAQGRETLTGEEIAAFDQHKATADEAQGQIKAQADSRARFDAVKGLQAPDADQEQGHAGPAAKSPGEAFRAHLLKSGRTLKSPGTIEGPEFKAATDTIAVGSGYGPALTEVDRTIVLPYREQPTVADLIQWGTMSGNAITYPVFGTLEGGTATVAEGAAKSQMSVTPLTWQTDALSEIAGWFTMTDDMAEDLDWVVSEINSTALYDLAMKEQAQLLNGNGTSPNLRGILNRSGVQTITQAAGESVADAIFRAIMAIQTATGFAADGIVANPVDYQALRLAKDSNGQYFGGGYFYAPYGNGGLQWQPPVWGTKTVVTTATAAKTVVVGAWAAGAKGYRKGGIRVESTNSHADNFTNDKITTRVKERVALAVRYPAAFAKVVLL